MTRKKHLIFSLFFLVSWGLLPLAMAQDTYNWNIDEGDEIIFEIEGKEGETAVLLGELTLTVDAITGNQIDYSLASDFSVDTGSYGDFMQDSGSFSSSLGYIANNNTELYSVAFVYSQDKYALMEDIWFVYVTGYFERFWYEYGNNDTYEWECTSNAKGYRIWFNDRNISEIWYFQALYNTDGLLENFAGGIITDGVEDYVKITRKGTSLFGYYIPGYSLLLLGGVGLMSVVYIIRFVNQRRKI